MAFYTNNRERLRTTTGAVRGPALRAHVLVFFLYGLWLVSTVLIVERQRDDVFFCLFFFSVLAVSF